MKNLLWIVVIFLLIAPKLHYEYLWQWGDKWYNTIDFDGVRMISWLIAIGLIIYLI